MLLTPKTKQKLKNRLEDFEPFSVTECILGLSTLLASVSGALILLVFLAEFSLQDYITGILFTIGDLVICLLIFCLVSLLKRFTEYLYEKFEIGEFEQCECDVLIGLGAISVLSIFPRIMVYFLERDLYLLNYPLIIFPFTCLIFNILFFPDTAITNKMNPITHEAVIGGVLIFNFILLIVSIIIGINFAETRAMIILSQIGLGVFCASSSIEFFLILGGALSPKNGKKAVRVVEPAAADPVIEEHESGLKIECKICLLDYSDTLIPRVLTECGHTICQKCADNLLNKINGRMLQCPYCQAITVSNGPARLLAKNHLVSDFVRNLKK